MRLDNRPFLIAQFVSAHGNLLSRRRESRLDQHLIPVMGMGPSLFSAVAGRSCLADWGAGRLAFVPPWGWAPWQALAPPGCQEACLPEPGLCDQAAQSVFLRWRTKSPVWPRKTRYRPPVAPSAASDAGTLGGGPCRVERDPATRSCSARSRPCLFMGGA